MKGIRLRTTRSVDIPVSGQALLDALPQGRHVGSQVVHVMRAKRSLELDDPSVHVFQLFFRAIRFVLEFGCRSVPRAYELECS